MAVSGLNRSKCYNLSKHFISYPDMNLEVSRFWSDRRLHDPIIRNNEPVLPRGGGSPDVGVLDHQGAKIWFRVRRTIRLHHCKLLTNGVASIRNIIAEFNGVETPNITSYRHSMEL